MLYKKGKVISIGKSYIIFETNNEGHVVFVAFPNNFKLDTFLKIFVFVHQTDHGKNIFGFQTFAERLLFTDLISINGVGPKTAMQLLKQGHKKVTQYIANKDHEILASVPWIGSKTASQIIFELSAKYSSQSTNEPQQEIISDLKKALTTLGFNNDQIKLAIGKIDLSKKVEDAVEDAIKVIASV